MTLRRQFVLLVAVLALTLAAFVVVHNQGTSAPAAGGVASDRKITIDADGTSLAAEVITPRGVERPALVVMPASWAQPATQYQAIGRALAGDGFLVVSYAQRGFAGSGGQVDLAGDQTQADAGRVIDWALRSTAADPKRIGMYGMSYGAGVSLLAAAKDPRIKAVAALSTWTDLAASYDPNNTSSTRALATLLGPGGTDADERDGKEVVALRSLLNKNPRAVGPRIRALSPTRSPASYVAQLNRNKTAIMLANGFQDSLFGPQQLVGFYEKLTTPKRLQLGPGDHGGPEASALKGDTNPVASAASAWLDHYLRGAANGIDTEAPIVLTDVETGAVHTLRRWPSVSAANTVRLGVPGSMKQTGSGAATSWTSTIVAGADTAASSGPAVSPFGTYSPPEAALLTVAKGLAFVWTGAAVEEPTSVGGTPQVTMRLASSRSSATVVAYLYDVSSTGTGRLMSVAPYTLTGLRPGRARQVSFALQPTAWTLPTGDRLVLAIDTVDPRYIGSNRTGARITASATADEPATLSVPSLP